MSRRSACDPLNIPLGAFWPSSLEGPLDADAGWRAFCYNERMRLLLALLLAGPMLIAADARWSVDFDDADLSQWHVPRKGDWELAAEGGNHFLRLAKEGPIGEPRRPVKFALWKPGCVSDFEAEVRLRRAGKSLLLAFGFQDRAHFYYAHLSADDGNTRVHNGLFKVNGGIRYRIGGSGSRPVLPTEGWHRVKVVRKIEDGSIELFVDGESTARFSVADSDFKYGWVGIGSFDETGDFDDFRLSGAASSECEAAKISPLDGD
ncbi:MAG: hypothetical protein O2968_09500 [Acidobacteria bacterium]|nr:hypothetical protein [Acidobacteriota bacterium]